LVDLFEYMMMHRLTNPKFTMVKSIKLKTITAPRMNIFLKSISVTNK